MMDSSYIQQLRNEFMQRLADDWLMHWKDKGHGRKFINFSLVKNKNSLYAELKDEIDKVLVARFGLAEAAERSISADSVRRVLDERWQSGFSKKIKDAVSIYLGYDCWEEFKTKQAPMGTNLPLVINQVRIVSIIPHPEAVQDWWQNQRIELNQNPGRKRRWWWAIGLVLLSTLGYGAYGGYTYWRTHRTFTTDDLARVQLKLLSRNNQTNPCIVRYAYDFSHLNIDSAEVRFSDFGVDDKNRQILKEPKGTFEFHYYKPGVQIVSMYYGKQELKTSNILVKSDGWVAFYDHLTKVSTLFRKKDYYVNGTLFLHPEKIIDPIHRNYYYLYFRNTRDFGIDIDNCSVEYRIKNSPDEFGISCYEAMMELTDRERNWFALAFIRKGCCDETKNGKPAHSLYFPRVLADWHVVRLVIKNKRKYTYLNGRLISENPYTETFSRLYCLSFTSKGSCMVDFVRVYDGTGKLAYSDDFDKVPVSTIGGY